MAGGGNQDGELSVTRGGLLYRLERRLGLIREVRPRLGLRMAVFALISWLPPAVLAAAGGELLLYLRDFTAHTRSLGALAVLVFADRLIDARVGDASYRLRGLVEESARGRLARARSGVERLCDSAIAEVLLLLGAYALAVLPRLGELHPGTSGWYIESAGHLTPAGWWYATVSLPLFLFLTLRWLWRYLAWLVFLAGASRLPLRLNILHPDQVGGLGFAGRTQVSFSFLALAASLVIAGHWANQIEWRGASVEEFRGMLLGLIGLWLVVILGPLALFAPGLWRLRLHGLRRLDAFTARHEEAFKAKWLDSPPEESPLGVPEISSLADLTSSFKVAHATRLVPFTRRDAVTVVMAVLAPMALPVLVAVPLGELFQRLAGALV